MDVTSELCGDFCSAAVSALEVGRVEAATSGNGGDALHEGAPEHLLHLLVHLLVLSMKVHQKVQEMFLYLQELTLKNT